MQPAAGEEGECKDSSGVAKGATSGTTMAKRTAAFLSNSLAGWVFLLQMQHLSCIIPAAGLVRCIAVTTRGDNRRVTSL